MDYFLTSPLCVNACCILQYITGHLFVFYTIGVIRAAYQIGSKSHYVFIHWDQNSSILNLNMFFVFDIFFSSSVSSQILSRSASLREYLGDGVKNTRKTRQRLDETSYQTRRHSSWWYQKEEEKKNRTVLKFHLIFLITKTKHWRRRSEKKTNLTKYLISFWIGGRERRPTPGSSSVASRRWVGRGFRGGGSTRLRHICQPWETCSPSPLLTCRIQPDGGRHAAATSRHSSTAVKRRSKNRPTSVRLAVAPFWSPLNPTEQT